MKKEHGPLQRVINFSGGKTSAYMTIRLYQPGDLVIFSDTGREHPKTYKFINDFEAHEGIPVNRIKWNNADQPFDAMLSKYNHRKLPYKLLRFCTMELKVDTTKRYLKSLGILRFEQFIGFRADEPQRVRKHVERFKKVKTRFPLYEWGVDKQMVNDFWTKKPYTLEIPSILGNCTMCFMKGKNALMAIMREFPELADVWISDEEKSSKHFGHTYIDGITYKQLRDMAQNNLFKDYKLEEVTPAFDCACTT